MTSTGATSLGTTAVEDRHAVDAENVYAENYARAILNILDDFGEERDQQVKGQLAVLNILEDVDTDRFRLESTQAALVNILEDFDVERRRVEWANADLTAVNETMRDFIGVAAHDLRSPLASMVGFSSLLTENWETLSEENRWKFVSTIDRQSHKLSRLVDDLLTLSSIEGGALSTQPEMVVVAEAIGQCLEMSSVDTSGVSVSCSPDLVVRADPLQLGRIIDNYVQNAFKYGKPPVRIEATRQGDLIEIRVRDRGPGVPADFESKLFGKFARANVPHTRDQKGAGLGLSIVHGLAEINGGQARYEPNVPNGSCFVVLLPADDRASR